MSTTMAEKIQALLAQAASTTHEGEREVFTRKAEALMVKWGIEEAELEAAASKTTRSAIIIESRCYTVPITGGVVLAECTATQIGQGIGTIRTLYSEGRPVYWMIGPTSDLDRAEMYMPSLLQQCADSWKVFLAARREEGYRYYTINERDRDRATFMRAYGSTVYQRLAELWQTEAATSTSGALVVRSEAVDAFMAEEYPNTRRSNKSNLGRAAAQVGGHRAGAAATISAGSVTR